MEKFDQFSSESEEEFNRRLKEDSDKMLKFENLVKCYHLEESLAVYANSGKYSLEYPKSVYLAFNECINPLQNAELTTSQFRIIGAVERFYKGWSESHASFAREWASENDSIPMHLHSLIDWDGYWNLHLAHSHVEHDGYYFLIEQG